LFGSLGAEGRASEKREERKKEERILEGLERRKKLNYFHVIILSKL